MTTPNSSMSESIPKMNMLIVSSREELILLRMRRESPNLIYMAGNDFLEVQLKGSFKMSEKYEISKAIIKAFLEDETRLYVKTLSYISNKANLLNIYKGFQTLPTHIGQTGYAVKLSGQKGEILIKASKNFDYIHYILEILKNMEQLIGESGKFVVELTLDLGEGILEYRVGPKYVAAPGEKGKYYLMNWEGAADECRRLGGQLPSIMSNLENQELRKVFS